MQAMIYSEQLLTFTSEMRCFCIDIPKAHSCITWATCKKSTTATTTTKWDEMRWDEMKENKWVKQKLLTYF